MIDIDFSRSGDVLNLKMRGHAGYRSAGTDIVCAAVSGIFYALLGFLANEDSGLRIGSVESGNVDVSCSERYSSYMRLAYIGFLQIALSYPGTARVSETVWQARVSDPARAAI